MSFPVSNPELSDLNIAWRINPANMPSELPNHKPAINDMLQTLPLKFT